jgi:hypothetical protein
MIIRDYVFSIVLLAALYFLIHMFWTGGHSWRH